MSRVGLEAVGEWIMIDDGIRSGVVTMMTDVLAGISMTGRGDSKRVIHMEFRCPGTHLSGCWRKGLFWGVRGRVKREMIVSKLASISNSMISTSAWEFGTRYSHIKCPTPSRSHLAFFLRVNHTLRLTAPDLRLASNLSPNRLWEERCWLERLPILQLTPEVNDIVRPINQLQLTGPALSIESGMVMLLSTELHEYVNSSLVALNSFEFASSNHLT